jgi:hypothetical protein
MAALNMRALDMLLAPAPTQTLADFTSVNLVVPELNERTTSGVINELNQRLQWHEGLPERLFVSSAAIHHELFYQHEAGWCPSHRPSALDYVAVYAVRTGACRSTVALAGVAVNPINFVALVVEPSGKPGEYERVVEVLNTLAHHPEALELMRKATSAEEILTILGSVSFHCR